MNPEVEHVTVLVPAPSTKLSLHFNVTTPPSLTGKSEESPGSMNLNFDGIVSHVTESLGTPGSGLVDVQTYFIFYSNTSF